MAQRRPLRREGGTASGGRRSDEASKDGSGNGALIVGAVIVGLFLIGKCSSSIAPTPETTAAQEVSTAQQALVSAVEEQTPAPIEELSAAAARRGAGRVKSAAVEGLAGEMIYSQNCYDVIARSFSWGKLDECGGFDAEASLTLGDGQPEGADKEVAWFDPEAGAGRYLKAAMAAGVAADAADLRLSALQSQVKGRHKVAPLPTPQVEETDTTGMDEVGANLDANGED